MTDDHEAGGKGRTEDDPAPGLDGAPVECRAAYFLVGALHELPVPTADLILHAKDADLLGTRARADEASQDPLFSPERHHAGPGPGHAAVPNRRRHGDGEDEQRQRQQDRFDGEEHDQRGPEAHDDGHHDGDVEGDGGQLPRF